MVDTSSLTYAVGDTSPSIVGTLTTPSGAAFDLTNATEVRFQMWAANDRRLVVDAAAVITSSAGGLVRYDPVAGDFDVAGEYESRWRIAWGNGSVQHTDPPDTITVAAP